MNIAPNSQKTILEPINVQDQFDSKRLDITSGCQVAVVKWKDRDGISDILISELARLNQRPIPFVWDAPLPDNVDVLLTFGPYGKTLPMWQQAASRSGKKPLVVHWNTEGMPDIRIPGHIMQFFGRYRSQLGRLANSHSKLLRLLAETSLVKKMDRAMHRWRYWGDYEHAYRNKWLHLLADSSELYARLRTRAGMPTLYMPWGGTPDWYADMRLERDIDVLWLGKRGSSRRSKILDSVVRELRASGKKVYVADSVESPFLFDEERTEYFNRSKITLNITRTWFDDNFSRFSMAAPNRSLIISEPMLPHCPECLPGVHYVSAPVPELGKTILYYLQNKQVTEEIAENAYQLTTQELTFANSVRKMLNAIAAYRAVHPEVG
jgi:hypothetical protein